MKRSEIVAAFRERADDEAQPYGWSDLEVWRYLNEAHREAAIRARLIRDASTAAIRSLAFVADATDVALSALVLDVTRARISGEELPMAIKSVEQMDDENPRWESRTSATPCVLVTERNGAGLKARLWPPAAEAGTLLLTVNRLPLTDLNTDDDSPEIPVQYHDRLIDWMLRCAYLKRDSETYNEKAAKEAEARFIASFGAFEDANVYRKQADRRTTVVRFQDV